MEQKQHENIMQFITSCCRLPYNQQDLLEIVEHFILQFHIFAHKQQALKVLFLQRLLKQFWAVNINYILKEYSSIIWVLKNIFFFTAVVVGWSEGH